jgi:hypothetical protein
MAQHTEICLHPMNRREYYRLGLYKCWECGNVIEEHQNSTSIKWLGQQPSENLKQKNK